MVRRVPSKHKNTPVVRHADSGSIVRLAALLLCGLVIAGGFVYAGGRHFAALKLGYETEKLRTQLETEREQQRRLLLERETAASPARLERAARQLGMQPMLPSQIEPVKPASGEASPASSGVNQKATSMAERKPPKPTAKQQRR